ncbi:MAG: 1-acyl-sn-glycerol-3-phosphate acyltransferase [Holosporaceae bacterium]|jgi:1-acyl-sn-glycerol-3-phosphate acyltransferase|nr:1-acyl-sn-glycerol-3-phosphate acyltransferase [Holosporaceae bacterium]
MVMIRSVIFNILFFASSMLLMMSAFPLTLLDEKYAFAFWKMFSKLVDFLSRTVAGIGYEIENEPQDLSKPVIYAVRHESVWETMVLIHKFKRPILVLKKELLNIPFFGSLALKAGSIDVDRQSGAKSLINAARKVKKALADGHPVIIFPEGTRVDTGRHAQIKRGIAFFYKNNNCPVIPVVHNSGKFWPRRGFMKKAGSIRMKFLDPIYPGLSSDEFMRQLNRVFYAEIERLKA